MKTEVDLKTTIHNGIEKVDLDKLIKSMKNYKIKKIHLSDTMKNNLDKLGIKYKK